MDILTFRQIKRFISIFGNESGVWYLGKEWFQPNSQLITERHALSEMGLSPPDKRWLFDVCKALSKDEYFVRKMAREEDEHYERQMWEDYEIELMKQENYDPSPFWEELLLEEAHRREKTSNDRN